jgi:hypothetical protein
MLSSARAIKLDHDSGSGDHYIVMKASNEVRPEIEFKDGKIVCNGRTWSPFGWGITFVAKALSVSWSLDGYSEAEIPKVALFGEAFIHCQGLFLIGEDGEGALTVNLDINAADESWLSEEVEGIPAVGAGDLRARAHLGYYPGEGGRKGTFFLSVYLPHTLFDTIVTHTREGRLESLSIRSWFVGLHASFPYGQASDTDLALAPSQHSGETARGRLDFLKFNERPTQFAEPYWIQLRREAFGIPEADVRPISTARPHVSTTERNLELTLARVERLLSQMAAASRWIVWGLVALVIAVALQIK